MAATKHVLKLSSIVAYFSEADEMKLISRGENAVESNHIKSFHFIANLGLLRGEVHASMRDRVYNVEVDLDQDGSIQGSTCTCPRGQYLCHHVAAVCIYGHHNISVTDVECRWTAKKTAQETVKTVSEMYVAKTHKSVNRNLTDDEVGQFRQNLQSYGTAVGFSWLLRPEPATSAPALVRDVEELIFSQEYYSSESKVEFFEAEMRLSPEQIREVCEATIGQAKNENWLTSRKNRLTASNFGVVLAAIQRNKYPPSLYKRLTGVYNLEGVSAVQWGISNEQQAVDLFQQMTGLQVERTGLWLDACGYIGASPDGFIGDNALIEVKCPFKYRTKVLEEELAKDSNYILKNVNNKFELNKNHEYYHQIQGTLLITNRMLCHLMIWTPQRSIIYEVPRDDEWALHVGLLKEFYIQRYLEYLIGNISFN